ncbi:uncharacterized protein LOC106669664 [Cimex lectularius]|uniref:Uncharacterized protein n=1 Tax=Cimex lectularius TaxID=79782 RepID=A0A8I6TG96_CIMLE|nr:uncharacterized protein LOC106669664 [Cimex lectularius]
MATPQPPPQHVLNEMRQQLELATTKCGSLLQQLDIVKDRVRKSSSTNLLDMVEDEESSQVQDPDKQDTGDDNKVVRKDDEGDDMFDDRTDNIDNMSDVYQDLSDSLNIELKEILRKNATPTEKTALEMAQEGSPDTQQKQHKSGTADSSTKSSKSRQDIIDIFFKRLETIENGDEKSNSAHSATSGALDNIDTFSYDDGDDYNDEAEDDDIGEFFSSIDPKERNTADSNVDEPVVNKKLKEELKDEKVETVSQPPKNDDNESVKPPKNENKNDVSKKRSKTKTINIPTKVPAKLSPYLTSLVKVSKKPSKSTLKTKGAKKPIQKTAPAKKSKDDKHILPMNDVLSFMKKVMNKKDIRKYDKSPTRHKSSIRSGKRKEDFVKRVPFTKPPTFGYRTNEPVRRSKSTIAPPVARQPPKTQQTKFNTPEQNNKKNTETNKKSPEETNTTPPVKPSLVDLQIKDANKVKQITPGKEAEKSNEDEDVHEKLVTSLVEKLRNIKQQDQRILLTNVQSGDNKVELVQTKKVEKNTSSISKGPPQGKLLHNYSQIKSKFLVSKNDTSNKTYVVTKQEQNKLQSTNSKVETKANVQQLKQEIGAKMNSQNKSPKSPQLKSTTNNQSKVLRDTKLNETTPHTEQFNKQPQIQRKTEIMKKVGIFEQKNIAGNVVKTTVTKVQKPNVVVKEGNQRSNTMPKIMGNVKPNVPPKEITNQTDSVIKEVTTPKPMGPPKTEANKTVVNNILTQFQNQATKKPVSTALNVPPKTACAFPQKHSANNSLITESQVNNLQLSTISKARSERSFQPSVKFNRIPFIVGQSTNKSYHIGLNIQQTLSLFKLTPSLISLSEGNPDKAISERSSAFTIFTSPSILQDKFRHPSCPACVHTNDSDDEDGDPWSIPQKDNFDQRTQATSQCNCLPKKLVSFHEVLSQLFQSDNKLFSKYQNYFVNAIPAQNEEDVEKIKEMVTDSQKSSVPYRPNNTFYYTRLLRSIQKLQDTFVK